MWQNVIVPTTLLSSPRKQVIIYVIIILYSLLNITAVRHIWKRQ